MAAYLDSSALVKLVVREPESTSLRRFLRAHPIRVASALVRVEVPRAVRARGADAYARALAVISRVRLLSIDDDILAAASLLDPSVLRSLDAIHLASALAFGADLAGIVTYDVRMQRAASVLGLDVFAPR